MTEQTVSVLPCPYCPMGRAAASIRLCAARAVIDQVVWLGAGQVPHPAVTLGADLPGPCPHLVDLMVWVDWTRLTGRARAPSGRLMARWRHPTAGSDGPDEIDQLYAEARGTGSDCLRLGIPFRVAEDRTEGTVEGHPVTRSWRWTVSGEALFATDSEHLCGDLLRAVRAHRTALQRRLP